MTIISKPVPVETMIHRLDRLAGLGTTIVTFSGGEPLLHPDLDDLIAHVRRRGMIAGMITNGYLLTAERVKRLNAPASITCRSASITSCPTRCRKRASRCWTRSCRSWPSNAEFHVNINSVLGGGIHNPDDALVVGKRALELGFTSTVGIIHDGDGQLRPIGERERAVFLAMKRFEKRNFSQLNRFQDDIANGRPSDWRCRAGARYIYVCEDGLVHYCSQQRGYPGKPLDLYTVEDIRREYLTAKGCAPYCTVSCVHQVAYMDFWRDPQIIMADDTAREAATSLVQIER